MNNKTKAIWVVMIVGFLLYPSRTSGSQSMEMVATGAVTPLLQYQGRLTDPTTGERVADGSYSMSFSLYNVDTGGTALWSESESVTVQNGLFSTVLGDTSALVSSLFNGQALWLGITVGGEELGPRQPVLPVAYALSLVPGAIVAGSSAPVLEVDHTSGGEALRVGGNLNVSGSLIGGSHTHAGEAITSGTVADARIASTLARDSEIWPTVLNSDGSGSALDADLLDGQQGSFFLNASNINAGTLGTGYYSAYSDLSGEGYLDLSAAGDLLTRAQGDGRFSASYHTHWGQAWTGTGTGLSISGGVIGLSAYGDDWGVFGGSDSTNGSGVYGWAGTTSGFTIGVIGQSNSTSGTGIYGLAIATSGSAIGVYGQSDSTAGRALYGWATADSGTTYGVYGTSNSTDGRGVYGYAYATNGSTYGVYGESFSTNGYGVYGFASATSGGNYGVYGYTNSDSGFGIGGYAVAASGYTHGVDGRSGSINGIAVFGSAFATMGTTYGVYGQVGSPGGYGVYGQATSSTSNYGVYSYGNFAATGTKAAVVETQDYGWLQLYAMESPDVLFEDVGTAQLIDGVFVVVIDPKFAETVNLSAPYQVFVTPLGDCALYVTDKTTTTFTVHAMGGSKCSLAFDYRIVARRVGYEDVRMATAADPNLTIQNGKPPEAPQP